MKARRLPWLSGLIVAVIGAVWMFVQVGAAAGPAVLDTIFDGGVAPQTNGVIGMTGRLETTR